VTAVYEYGKTRRNLIALNLLKAGQKKFSMTYSMLLKKQEALSGPCDTLRVKQHKADGPWMRSSLETLRNKWPAPHLKKQI